MAAEGIEPIRDDVAHCAALKAIDRLWGARQGTPQGYRLEALMTFVDQYERSRWPDEDLDPRPGAVSPPVCGDIQEPSSSVPTRNRSI